MQKKIIILLFLLMLFPIKSKACSEDEIIRLSNLANNVNVVYEYNKNNDTFSIIFTNVTDELVISDYVNHKDYVASKELTIKNLKSNNYTFYIYARNKNCIENELTLKNIKLPYYNSFYNSKECENKSNFSYCSKWLNRKIEYKEWKEKIDDYKVEEEVIENNEESKSILDLLKNIFVNFYITYYYILLPLIITSLCVIIYLKNKIDEII